MTDVKAHQCVNTFCSAKDMKQMSHCSVSISITLRFHKPLYTKKQHLCSKAGTMLLTLFLIYCSNAKCYFLIYLNIKI